METWSQEPASRAGSNTAGIISMVLGIFAILASLLPYFGIVGLLFATPVIVLAIIGFTKSRSQSVVTPIIGLIAGGIGLLFSGMWALILVVAAASR